MRRAARLQPWRCVIEVQVDAFVGQHSLCLANLLLGLLQRRTLLTPNAHKQGFNSHQYAECHTWLKVRGSGAITSCFAAGPHPGAF